MGANWSFVGSRLLAALSLCPCVARLRVSPARVFVLDKMAFYTSANTTYHGLLPIQPAPNCRCDQHGRTTSPLFLSLRCSLKAPFLKKKKNTLLVYIKRRVQMQASEYEMGSPNIRAKGIVFGTSKEFLHINEKDVKSNRK